MKKYRIIETDSNAVLEEGMSLLEAQEVMSFYSDPSSPQYQKALKMVEYQETTPEGKRLGRDPDLH